MGARSSMVAIIFVAMAIGLTGTVGAQSALPPNIRSPIPDGAIGVETAAPDWLVWRAFYDSLEFYDREKPGVALQILDLRAGLNEAVASAVLTAGRTYLAALAKIDGQVRERIKREYQSNGIFALPDNTRRPNGELVQSEFLAGETRDGRDLRDALVADGVLSDLERRRGVALKDHLRQMTDLIGAKRLAQMEEWLRADIAPGVAVVTRAIPVDPPFNQRSPSAATEASR